MEEQKTVTVLIPTYRPDGRLREILRRLSLQTEVPERLLLINTLQENEAGGGKTGTDENAEKIISDLLDEFRDRFPRISVFHIERDQFNHGGTRNMGVMFAETDLVLCMTQDALPRDRHLVRNLKAAFSDPKTAAAYARQLPSKKAPGTEKFARQFNYPPSSRVKSGKDLEELGIKTFFCSDVCAMWRRDVCLDMGGFEKDVIFNEDMILAGRMIQAGWQIAYCADAMVYHSHEYSALRQMRRSFDLGVSQADHPEVFGMASSRKEGIRYVKAGVHFLWQEHELCEIPGLLAGSAFRYAGYRLGKSYRRLPGAVIMKLTDSPWYWKNKK